MAREYLIHLISSKQKFGCILYLHADIYLRPSPAFSQPLVPKNSQAALGASLFPPIRHGGHGLLQHAVVCFNRKRLFVSDAPLYLCSN